LSVLAPLRVSVAEPPVVLPEAEPLALEPVSVPEVVLLGAAGVVGLALVVSDDGVSDGEVRVWCIELVSLEVRPCPPCFFLCFLCAELPLVASSLLPLGVEPLMPAELPALAPDELSLPMPVLVEPAPTEGLALDESSFVEELVSSGLRVLLVEVSLLGAELAEGLLLGSDLLLLLVLDELPGRALLFWSAGSVAVPLSSVVWLLGVLVVLVSLVPVPVDV
jgi:hypothetical protein